MYKNPRYKIAHLAPANRAQRRAAARGKDFVHAGSAKREKGKTLLKPFSESGLDFDKRESK